MVQEVHLSNSVTDEYGAVFVARQLRFEQANPEESEQLKIKKVSFANFYNMVEEGEITDSLSIIAAYKIQKLIDENKI